MKGDDMATFDISVAFDKAEYLNTQIKLFADTMKDKIPRGVILHVVTNREGNDPNLLYLLEKIPNHILYIQEPPKDLISRCKYLMNALKVNCKKDYLVKMDLDIIPFGNINDLMRKIDGIDLLIQMENRRIIQDDNIESRVWRQIYKAMGLKVPDIKISYIERVEIGKPLFNTGIFVINTHLLNIINENWERLTKIAEDWIDFNIHPNEFAFTAMAFNYGWKYELMSKYDVFNPIGNFRKGEFPSTELTEKCQIPEGIILLHWHKPRWLKHLHKYNNIKILNGLEYLNDSFWDISDEVYKENYGL
jgi:hypothetical protein